MPSPNAEPPHFLLLPWQAGTLLLCLICVPVAWICSSVGGRIGGEETAGELAVWAFVFIVLVGCIPFFMRRNHAFTLGGLVAVGIVGLGLAALGWLIGYNFAVFAWMGMMWTVQVVAKPTARGLRIQQQIALEKANSRSWLNTKTEQKERMLAVYDIAAVLLVGLVLLWLVSWGW